MVLYVQLLRLSSLRNFQLLRNYSASLRSPLTSITNNPFLMYVIGRSLKGNMGAFKKTGMYLCSKADIKCLRPLLSSMPFFLKPPACSSASLTPSLFILRIPACYGQNTIVHLSGFIETSIETLGILRAFNILLNFSTSICSLQSGSKRHIA